MIGMAAKDLQYMLVRWIGEETLSVLPSCKSRGGDIPIVGLTGDFRWSGRYYEGEILALSANRQKLNTLLKQLGEMVITREELLEIGNDADVSAEADPAEPDSTTPNVSPQKSSTQKRKRKLLKPSQTLNTTKDPKKAAKIKSYQERAQQMFKEPPYIPKEKSCDNSDGSKNYIEQLQKELADLKQQLSNTKSVSKATKKTQASHGSETIFKSTSIVGNYNDTESELDGFEMDQMVDDFVKPPKVQVKSPKTSQYVGSTPSRYSQKNPANRRSEMSQTPKTPKPSQYHSNGQEEEMEFIPFDDYVEPPKVQVKSSKTSQYVGSTSSRYSQKNPANCRSEMSQTPKAPKPSQYHSSGQEGSPKENDDCLTNTFTPKMKQLELVEGYGVYLTQKQYDEVIDQSGNSPTRMIRNLMTVFFKPTTLAQSSCLGKRGKHPPLNQDVVSACLKFVMNKFPSTKRPALVNDVNDKCANFRRKATTKEH